jgi:hypothetical protein
LIGAGIQPGSTPRTGTSSGWFSLVALERHREAPNITFVDGQADTVPLSHLWKLKWSQAFQPKEVKIAN